MIRWSTKIMECSMCSPWRAELPSETVLMFCRLCWGCGNIWLLCVSVAAGSCSNWCIWCLCTVHDILWGWEGCWLLQNVKYSRLKTFKVTQRVCVCVCVFVCVYMWSTIWFKLLYFLKQKICYSLLCCHKHRHFGTDCWIIRNTDSCAVYHTGTAHISDTRSAAAMWQ